MAIVGSLDAAIAKAREVVADRRTCYVDFVVVTPEPAKVDIPGARIGRHYEAVARHLFEWTLAGRSGIVVVDATLGSQLRGELRCLGHLGADGVYVVDEPHAPAASVVAQLEGFDGPVVVGGPPDDYRLSDARR